MLEAARGSDRFDTYLEVMQKECRRETELVDELLDLQRLGADRYRLELEAIEIEPYIAMMLENFADRARAHSRRLVFESGTISKQFVTDRNCFDRILHELLNNACKYAQAEGEILVELSQREDGTVEMAIGNTAQVPPEALPLLFDKFFRLESLDRWQEGGTGLGLSLVAGMVKLLGGTIAASSQNSWTQFQVVLPPLTLAASKGRLALEPAA